MAIKKKSSSRSNQESSTSTLTTTSPFKVSHSKIKLSRKCLKAYKYRYIDKVEKRVKSRPLIVGSLIHSCIESYFRNGHYLPEIVKWRELEFKKMFKEEQVHFGDVPGLVKELIRGYIKTWHKSGLEMVWVEKEFSVEISPGIILIGKIDGFAQDNRKLHWLVEHKSCKRMPGEDVRLNDVQAVLYQNVLPILGEPKIAGVVWDYVRTKLPMRPELLAKGGLSTRKNIDTTPETYLREIKRHGFDIIGYMDILSDLELKRDQFYRQVKLPFNKTMASNIMIDFTIDSIRMREMERNYYENEVDDFTRNLNKDCSWCDYSTLCHSELRGDDTEYLLKHDYKARKKDEEEIRVINIEED